MRIDFREERKWKIALAFELSTAVLEWHRAGSEAERKRLGIIVLWHKARDEQVEEVDDGLAEDVMDHEESQPEEGNLPSGDYGSDDSDDDQDQDKQDVVDALETSVAVDDAIEDSQRTQVETQPSRSQAVAHVRPKEEDMDDTFPLRGATEVPMDVDQSQQPTPAAEPSSQTPDPAISALRQTSINPVLGSDPAPTTTAGHPTTSSHRPSSKSNAYAPYRSQIAYSDESTLFLNLDDFPPVKKPSSSSAEHAPSEEAPPPADLASLFPDLQMYTILDVAPDAAVVSSTNSDSKKKTKVDREDPHKRIEESTLMKLAPLSRFTREKPTLLGPLQPSKHWKDGHWTGLDEGLTSADLEGSPPRVGDEVSCGMSVSISVFGSKLTFMVEPDSSI